MIRHLFIVVLIAAAIMAATNLIFGFFIDKNEPVVITSFTGVNRYKLHLYDNYDWAEEHFKEFESLKTQYKSYLGWRRVPYRGTTITIEEDGCRSHLHDQDDKMPTIWFFGGSTMWGTGVSDKYTIPAIFQKKYNYNTKNFGESGFRSRQELAQLINALFTNDKKPKYVIFYDGVNDSYYSIFHKAVNMKHFYEDTLNEQLEEIKSLRSVKGGQQIVTLNYERLRSFFSNVFYNNVLRSYKRIDQNVQVNSGMSLQNLLSPCEISLEQLAVIESGVKEQLYVYSIANEVCKANGIDFYVFIQPYAWIGNPMREQIVEDMSLKPKCSMSLINKYYSVLRNKAKGVEFIYDISNSFDMNIALYIDDCHVTPDGNTIIADKIYEILFTK